MDCLKFIVSFFNASIRLSCRFSAGAGLEILIGTNFIGPDAVAEGKEISFQGLALFPAFLRFRKVQISYDGGSQPIADKCQSFDGCLQSIKSAINDSCLILFVCKVDQNDESHFSDHQTLIEYLRDRLLPICDSSRAYSFDIVFDSDKNSSSSVIDSILQMSQINCYSCFDVFIGLIDDANPAQLPIDTISKWLHRSGTEIRQKQKDNFLLICSYKAFQNIPEMCDLLKTVYFTLFFIKHSLNFSFYLIILNMILLFICLGI